MSGLWSSHFPCVLFKAFSWYQFLPGVWHMLGKKSVELSGLRCHSASSSSHNFSLPLSSSLIIIYGSWWEVPLTRLEPQLRAGNLGWVGVWCVHSTQSQVSDGWRSLSHVMLHSKTPGHCVMWFRSINTCGIQHVPAWSCRLRGTLYALKECASAANVTWNIYAWETCMFSHKEVRSKL